MQQITLTQPDDWHLHFRDNDMLLETVPATARTFKRAIVMPNLVPPVVNAELASAYRERILAARPLGSDFEPLMTLFLTNTTTVEDIRSAKKAGVVAAKLYPAGATTNSDAAVITPQHLLLNRNDLLVGGVRPHNFCLPVLKRSTHQQALRKAVATGSSKFFLGTDSAPHEKHAKESACGCAGCYSAWSALELYAQVFEELDALDKLEGFASHHGADFYGLPRNTKKITLVKDAWQVPESITLPNGELIVPFFAGQTVQWALK